jgi:ribosomal protein S18 acetylase RimI-like enzyme
LGFVGRKGDVVSWLFVHPDHRRRGIGGRLMKRIMDTWEGTLTLKVAQSNQAAIDLYSRLGFEVYEAFEGHMYGHPIPIFRMRLHRGSMVKPAHRAQVSRAADTRLPSGDGSRDR